VELAELRELSGDLCSQQKSVCNLDIKTATNSEFYHTAAFLLLKNFQSLEKYCRKFSAGYFFCRTVYMRGGVA